MPEHLPTIVIAGTPAWANPLRDQLTAEYAIVHLPARAGYFNALIETRAAMIFVDGDLPDWPFFTATPKSSPATRRIPIVLVSENDAIRAQSAVKGADLAFTTRDLLRQAKQLVADFGRISSPDMLEQLDCECQEVLPPLARQGVEKFNTGEYYKQHDLFEEQWVNTAGPVRDLYRAILQVGIAYFQIERGNYRGALKMFQRSVQWLAILPDVCQGVDVRQLREDSYRARAELERLGEARLHEFDRDLIQKLRLREN